MKKLDVAVSHYVRWDMPLYRVARSLRAVCGREVPRKEWSARPTCPECETWLQEYDRLVLVDDDSKTGIDRPDRPREAMITAEKK